MWCATNHSSACVRVLGFWFGGGGGGGLAFRVSELVVLGFVSVCVGFGRLFSHSGLDSLGTYN